MPAGMPTVGIVTIQAQDLTLTDELPGRTVAYQAAEVRPQVSGLIEARQFREGAEVKAGDRLYQIDPETYQANLDRSIATLAKAEANLVPVRTKAQRYSELVAIHAVSQQDADDARSALEQAQADVRSSRAAVESDRISLKFTHVTAPISGRIGRSTVTAGALVTASQSTALATIQQLDPIYVDVTQPSAAMLQLQRAFDAGKLQRSVDGAARVSLKMEDGSTYPLPGKLQFSESTVDASTGAVTLRAVFPNPRHELLPGMYVHAVVAQGVKTAALLVPQRAVQRDTAGRPVVYRVGIDGKVEVRPLVVARSVGNAWLVTDGLGAGDQVVVEGLQNARAGAVVNTVPWMPPADSASAAGPVRSALATTSGR